MLVLKCQLKFEWFPLDTHECSVTFEMEQPNSLVTLNFTRDLLKETPLDALAISGFEVKLSQVESYNKTKYAKLINKEGENIEFITIHYSNVI